MKVGQMGLTLRAKVSHLDLWCFRIVNADMRPVASLGRSASGNTIMMLGRTARSVDLNLR